MDFAGVKLLMLIDRDFIDDFMTKDIIYAQGHAAEVGYLGLGMLYYAISYMLKAELCICLGSGGGFVPRCMRQAQRDLQLDGARTILIDDGSERWGKTTVHDMDSFFRREFPEVEVLKKNTNDAFLALLKDKVDYVHVDANHGYSFVSSDWQNYRRLLKSNGVMTFHDTRTECGVPRLINGIRRDPAWDVVDLIEIGAGVALVKRAMI